MYLGYVIIYQRAVNRCYMTQLVKQLNVEKAYILTPPVLWIATMDIANWKPTRSSLFSFLF